MAVISEYMRDISHLTEVHKDRLIEMVKISPFLVGVLIDQLDKKEQNDNLRRKKIHASLR